MKLVDTWIAAEKKLYGNSQGKAVHELNAQLEMSVSQSRVSEWRRGVYLPSVLVVGYMLARSLSFMLREAGIAFTEGDVNRLESLIWEPDASEQ